MKRLGLELLKDRQRLLLSRSLKLVEGRLTGSVQLLLSRIEASLIGLLLRITPLDDLAHRVITRVLLQVLVVDLVLTSLDAGEHLLERRGTEVLVQVERLPQIVALLVRDIVESLTEVLASLGDISHRSLHNLTIVAHVLL